jgi:hypothetical protein
LADGFQHQMHPKPDRRGQQRLAVPLIVAAIGAQGVGAALAVGDRYAGQQRRPLRQPRHVAQRREGGVDLRRSEPRDQRERPVPGALLVMLRLVAEPIEVKIILHHLSRVRRQRIDAGIVRQRRVARTLDQHVAQYMGEALGARFVACARHERAALAQHAVIHRPGRRGQSEDGERCEDDAVDHGGGKPGGIEVTGVR